MKKFKIMWRQSLTRIRNRIHIEVKQSGLLPLFVHLSGGTVCLLYLCCRLDSNFLVLWIRNDLVRTLILLSGCFGSNSYSKATTGPRGNRQIKFDCSKIFSIFKISKEMCTVWNQSRISPLLSREWYTVNLSHREERRRERYSKNVSPKAEGGGGGGMDPKKRQQMKV